MSLVARRTTFLRSVQVSSTCQSIEKRAFDVEKGNQLARKDRSRSWSRARSFIDSLTGDGRRYGPDYRSANYRYYLWQRYATVSQGKRRHGEKKVSEIRVPLQRVRTVVSSDRGEEMFFLAGVAAERIRVDAFLGNFQRRGEGNVSVEAARAIFTGRGNFQFQLRLGGVEVSR